MFSIADAVVDLEVVHMGVPALVLVLELVVVEVVVLVKLWLVSKYHTQNTYNQNPYKKYLQTQLKSLRIQ